MRLACPFCGLRDEGEFAYEGPVMDWPALDARPAKWVDAVYLRDQPRGETRELWRHHLGCGSLLEVVRNNVTHEVASVGYADPAETRALKVRVR